MIRNRSGAKVSNLGPSSSEWVDKAEIAEIRVSLSRTLIELLSSGVTEYRDLLRLTLGKALAPNKRDGRRRELAMPRRRRSKVNRIAIPAAELESKIMERVRDLRSCSKLRGVEFVFVGSSGQEPNWFARPLPSRVSGVCMREFVATLARVRREFDLQLET